MHSERTLCCAQDATPNGTSQRRPRACPIRWGSRWPDKSANVESVTEPRTLPALPAAGRRGQRPLLIAALAFFAVGVASIIAIFILQLAGAEPQLALYLLSMLSPIGLLLGVGTVFVSGMLDARRARHMGRSDQG